MSNGMKISVKGPARDLIAFFGLKAQRKRRFRRAASGPPPVGAMNRLAEKLHPAALELVIDLVRTETADTRTFRLRRSEGGELPYFRAGQYLSVKTTVAGNRITRPYTISSAPSLALDPGFYEITIRKYEGGFFTEHAWQNWETGVRLESSSPLGWFYYEPLRDTKNLVFIAGGCGITPFKPMVAHTLSSYPEVTILLLYGVTDMESIIYKDDLSEIETAYPGRFRPVYVDSGALVREAAAGLARGRSPAGAPPGPDAAPPGLDSAPAAPGPDAAPPGLDTAPAAPAGAGPAARAAETGFIDRRIIARYVSNPRDATFFICGPRAMYRFLENELDSFNLAPGSIRQEAAGDVIDVTKEPDYPRDKRGEAYTLTVRSAGGICTVPAKASESVLQALERGGLSPPSECRSGECGYCRSKFISGEIYGINNHRGRRMADAGFGYFHPCSSYPLSDLEISIPVDPLLRRD